MTIHFLFFTNHLFTSVFSLVTCHIHTRVETLCCYIFSSVFFVYVSVIMVCRRLPFFVLTVISLTTVWCVVVVVDGRLDLSPDHAFKYCVGPSCFQNDLASDEPMGCQKNSERMDPTNCLYYYVCEDGLGWKRQMCPEDMAFSPTFQFCIRKEYVKCETTCGRDGTFRDDDDCQKFYVCSYSRAFSFHCPKGTVFDETSGQCVQGSC